jgi:low affinity Fe/Cu permease
MANRTAVAKPVAVANPPSRQAAEPQTVKPKKPASDWFGHFSSRCSSYLGSRWAFAGAIFVIAMWAVTGPLYHYSDTWQLIINTGTTIVTFLMVFLIQNTQNRDARAINLKLNELIRATGTARDQMIDIENLSDDELAVLSLRYEKISKEYARRKTSKSA